MHVAENTSINDIPLVGPVRGISFAAADTEGHQAIGKFQSNMGVVILLRPLLATHYYSSSLYTFIHRAHIMRKVVALLCSPTRVPPDSHLRESVLEGAQEEYTVMAWSKRPLSWL